MGTLNVLGHFARILIDLGATHSAISHMFAQLTQSPGTSIRYDMFIAMPHGDLCFVQWEYKGCPVTIGNQIIPANFILVKFIDFDVILGMDWLSQNYAMVDCRNKVVTFQRPGLPMVTFVGEYRKLKHGLISTMKVKKMLKKGCEGYLANVVVKEDNSVRLEDVNVVNQFPDVFPKDLLGLPPDQEIEFNIDLMPGTNLISLAPYRMAFAELRKLKA